MARGRTTPRTPEATRRKILEAAFGEFYANSFQGGSLNDIVAAAGTTKGALFHHFDSKLELGYAVLDHLIGPLLLERWLAGLAEATDPISVLQTCFRVHVATDITTGHWLNGCPLNNLAQEMSPLDDGFHTRINRLYDTWRGRIAEALHNGIHAGTVKASIDPHTAAALIVSGQMGIWGTGKSSRRADVMLQAAEGLCDYLESLRP